MKVIVTGGAGFIGSAVSRRLVRGGDQIVVLDKLTYAGSRTSLAEAEGAANFRFVQGDICDAVGVRRLFAAERPDAILHLAAESHVDRSIDGPGAFIETNVIGTFTLLQVALEYWRGLEGDGKARFRFHHVSTDEVYGSLSAEGLFKESTPYDPRSPYSASKAASDHLVSAWGHTYGLPVLISNCSNNYGPYHFPEKLIPLTILNALEGTSLPVYGDGSNVRDWLYVDDHAAALELILKTGRPGDRYNVGGRNERTNLHVVHAICDVLDRLRPRPGATSRRNLITFVTDRPGHDQRYAIDASKLEDELGWRAAETFETGLERTIRWYLDNEVWWAPLKARYAQQRLGLAPARSAPSTPVPAE